jgi:undecaprenyl-diphosphatase
VSAAISPFVFEYTHDYPWTLALEALPLYDAIARVKVQSHWQTDVLAAYAIGTAAGYYAHSRDSPFFLEVLPHGVGVGIRKQW